jgi:DNA-directed RNA polymerase sigma subunit (sigma70/sigma32)
VSSVVAFPYRPHNLDLTAALAELEGDERKVIEARWGIGCELMTDDEVAEKYDWDIEWVWELHDKALQTLGFLFLTMTLLPSALLRDVA